MGRRGEHTKEELAALALDAAVSLLESEGPDRLTTRAVAECIGYTVGSLYFLFRNRDDLVVQVNERTLDELKSNLERAVEDYEDPGEALLAMGRAYIVFAAAHAARWRLIFEHDLADDSGVPESLLRRIEALFALVETRLGQLVSDLGTPELRRSAASLWSGVHGIAVLSVTGKLGVAGATEPEALAQDLISHYLRGLRIGADGPKEGADPVDTCNRSEPE